MEIDALRRADVFRTLDASQADRLTTIAREHRLDRGECLFLLGEHADRLYLVLAGSVELSLPLVLGGAVREVAVECRTPVQALGWSALVPPFRYTLSARAVEPSVLVGFPRNELLSLFQSNPYVGYVFTQYVMEVMGRRLLQVQALWARELQRTVTGLLGPPGESRP